MKHVKHVKINFTFNQRMFRQWIFIIETQKTGQGVAHGCDQLQFGKFLTIEIEKRLNIQISR